jgi:hypothetical protein
MLQHRTVADVRSAILGALETTATDLGAPGRDDKFGWGLVNGEKFMARLST